MLLKDASIVFADTMIDLMDELNIGLERFTPSEIRSIAGECYSIDYVDSVKRLIAWVLEEDEKPEDKRAATMEMVRSQLRRGR